MRNLIVAGLLLIPTCAAADGNELLKDCGATVAFLDGAKPPISEGHGIGFCLGFMQGIAQTNLIYQSVLDRRTSFCLPDEGVKNGQAARIVVKYLRDRPQELHRAEIILAFSALVEAFPCKKER